MLSQKFWPVDLPSTSPTVLLPTPQIQTSPGHWDWSWRWTAVAPWEILRDDTPSDIKCGSQAVKELGDLRVSEIFFTNKLQLRFQGFGSRWSNPQNAWINKLDAENYNVWSPLGHIGTQNLTNTPANLGDDVPVLCCSLRGPVLQGFCKKTPSLICWTIVI